MTTGSVFLIDNTLSPPLSELHGQENFTISGIWLTQIVDKATSPNNECILIRVCQPYTTNYMGVCFLFFSLFFRLKSKKTTQINKNKQKSKINKHR